MISMLYWELLTSSAVTMKVAVLAEASTAVRRVMPDVGVTPEPCCNLMVTVELEGSFQVMVKGWPAVTCRPPGGILMALFCAIAAATRASKDAKYFMVAMNECWVVEQREDATVSKATDDWEQRLDERVH